MLILRNITTGVDMTATVESELSALDRVIGWLAAAHINPTQGKWLRPCSAIHTLGMRSAIDVVFLDKQSRVLAMYPRVSPHRLWLGHQRAASVLEMGPGFLDSAMITVGDSLMLVDPAPASI